MDEEEKRQINNHIKYRHAFKELFKLINKNLDIHPILIGELALTDYFFGYKLEKNLIEFLIEEEYCYGKKKQNGCNF